MNLSLSATSSLPELPMRPAQGVSSLPEQADAGGFADVLKRLAGETTTAVREGEAAALSGIAGTLPLQTVVERVMAAERTLQTALAVRDKAVTSYLEISRMQI